ncbi:MAG: hypothetical protein RXO43_00345 [Candidatus Micrarchaeota archaeon]
MIGPNSGGDNQTNFDPTNLQNNANTPSNTSSSMQGSVKQKSNNGMLIKAIAALIIIVIVAYLAYSFTKPAYSNPVIALLSTGKPVSMVAVVNAMINTVNATNKLNVSYTGTVELHINSFLTGSLSTSAPIEFSYEKYYNISRISFGISDVPLVGNMSSVIIKNGSTLYTCSKTSFSGLLMGTSNYTCTKNLNTTISQIQTPGISNITNTTKELNITVHGVKEISNNKITCYLMQGSGKLNIPLNNTNSNAFVGVIKSKGANFTYNLTSCVSTQYGIPINVSGSIAEINSSIQFKILLSMNATYINNNTNPEIASLPGPILSNPSFFGNICIPSSGFLCINPELNNGTLKVTLGQATGETWSNVTYCFVPNSTVSPSSCSNFPSSTLVGRVYSGESSNVSFSSADNVTFPVTPGGTISGTIWASYNTNGSKHMTKLATIIVGVK